MYYISSIKRKKALRIMTVVSGQQYLDNNNNNNNNNNNDYDYKKTTRIKWMYH